MIARTHTSSTITRNYIDNCFLEWTNEQDAAPEFNAEFSFSALTIADNIFLSGDVAPWFSYIVIKPHGPGHFLSGVTITGNHFRSINGSIDRAERVDTSFADLDYTRMKDVTFAANSFHNVRDQVFSPLTLRHSEATPATTWVVETAGKLPFGARVLSVDGIATRGAITNAAGTPQFYALGIEPEQGSNGDLVHLTWPEAVQGEVQITLRLDT